MSVGSVDEVSHYLSADYILLVGVGCQGSGWIARDLPFIVYVPGEALEVMSDVPEGHCVDVHTCAGCLWCPGDEAFVVVSEQFFQCQVLCESLPGEPSDLAGISVLVPVVLGCFVSVDERHDCSSDGFPCPLFGKDVIDLCV